MSKLYNAVTTPQQIGGMRYQSACYFTFAKSILHFIEAYILSQIIDIGQVVYNHSATW
jgi:hypothetical protein